MQTIWITGGSSGIGFATAKEFINNNWQVVISSSNKIKLESAKKKLELNNKKNLVHAIICDISSKNNVDETINSIEKNIGKIDIALLNASAYSPNKNQIFDISNYELLVDVNIKGTLYCVNKLKDVMKNRNNTIAIISSPLGYRGWPTAGAYGISKAAQLSLSESLYFDFKKLNINVRVICPGFIESDMTNELTSDQRDQALSQIPLGNFGSDTDIAKLTLFLSSDNAKYITGQSISVDGGMYM